MPRSPGASPRERQILQEEIAEPLKRLRRTAGDPACGKIAKAAGLSRNTVDNVFNARRLARSDTIEAIVTALNGDVVWWRRRWAAVRDRLDDLNETCPEPSATAALTVPPGPPAKTSTERADTGEPSGPTGRPGTGRRVRRVVVTVVAALMLVAVGGVVWVAEMGDAVSGAAPAHATGDRNGHVQPLPHDLPYVQCGDRTHSILSGPGRSRGGTPLGEIHPGERFIVTGQTAFWKYGHTDGTSPRTGWVLADYLCHADRTPTARR